MSRTVRWGILGPGRIAGKFAAGLREAAGAELAAVGSRSRERAEAFAAAHGAPAAWGSYEELAADDSVEAVYVATPHAFHAEHAVLCLEHGKHVLCEKPLALNAAQAERMVAAARRADRLLMEGMWTRFLPAVVRARALLAAGAVGEPRLLQADFGFRAAFDPRGRLFAPELGGGALLDLGVYPVSLAVMLWGEPVRIAAAANLGPTGVDEEGAILLQHRGGQLALLACALRLDTQREAVIQGTAGRIRLHHPWWAASRLTVTGADGRQETSDLPARGGGFAHEAEAFMDLVRAGCRDAPRIPLAESLAVMRTLDAVRDQWGLVYPGE